MTHRLLIVLLSCSLLASWGAQARQQALSPGCTYDRERLLSLNEEQFDQDMDGGWRMIAARRGCDLAAADLIRDWRQKHASSAGLLIWHEGQLRANAGQTQEAIALMAQTRRAPGVPDGGGWNVYVDATLAFLRKDRPALEKARSQLAAIQPPGGKDAPITVVDGYFDVDLGNGKTHKMRWPPNIDVVEGLIRCFDRPYVEAYGGECQPRPH